ncbi:eukaryotic aspartyl protease family protein [Striga asiatica]|uniref:Eukaryotic aspartyl protease family protein n=1 Tax=Striga asiatica TaxID=4170 RepID=A0A5A7QLM8_STRAF|nr:eukaryotic aspartyl protease family protein [Striga asiatica]
MSSFSVCWLLFLLLLPILTLYPSCWASSNSITLSLTTQSHDHHSENNSHYRLSLMAQASIQRARHLKCSTSASTPLFANDNEYSTTLGFGTPQQPLDFILDTGSNLVWFPCDNYTCTDCDATNIPTFNPKLSSSSRNVSCSTPQLKRIFPDDPLCTSCWNHPTSNCSKHNIPYKIRIVQIYTSSRIDEKLKESRKMKPRTIELVLDNSLIFNIYTSTSGSSKQMLGAPKHSINGSNGIVPISVKVNIPIKDLVPNANGYGGTIVDSGTTLTIMEKSVFDPIAHELNKQLLGKRYTRSKEEEAATGLELCYSVPRKANISDLPALTFVFAGSAQMVMPFENSFFYDKESAAICSTMISYDAAVGGKTLGPAMIFGNYMQQNFHMEFDLLNNQLGFYPTDCTRG